MMIMRKFRLLNDNGMISGGEKAVSAATLFPKKHENLDLEDKFIYSVTPLDSEIWLNPQTYKDIYSQKVQNNGE